MLKCDKNRRKKGSLTKVSRALPKIILKYGYLQNERRHEFCNPDTILVFIIIGAETRPCVVSRGPIHLFYFQVCLLSLFCIKSYLCIWYVREGKILVNLDVAWLKREYENVLQKMISCLIYQSCKCWTAVGSGDKIWMSNFKFIRKRWKKW